MSSNSNFPDTADAGDSVCPVSGLKITAKPEWSDIKLSENHHVSFWFIGDRILYIKPRGLPEPDSIKELFRQKTKVLEAVLGSGEKYLELRDLARVRDNSTIAVRKQMVEGLQADQDRMLGLVACHAPVGIKLSWNVGKRLYRFPAPISVVR